MKKAQAVPKFERKQGESPLEALGRIIPQLQGNVFRADFENLRTFYEQYCEFLRYNPSAALECAETNRDYFQGLLKCDYLSCNENYPERQETARRGVKLMEQTLSFIEELIVSTKRAKQVNSS